MARLTSSFGRSAIVAAALAASTALATAQCSITLPLGTNLGLVLDDSLSGQTPLGFQFPFNGLNYDSVYVCSNGFLYLFDSAGAVPPPTSTTWIPSIATILASTSPMICGPWLDLAPNNGGTVNFNTFPGSPASATITWDQVPEVGQSNLNSFQLRLWDNGQMDFYWSPNVLNISHDAMVGWSEGNNTADPGATNFSSAPLNTAAVTAYELFGAGTFDLSGRGFTAIPIGNRYLIVPAPCATSLAYGQGCPPLVAGSSTPIGLDAQAGSRPQLGSTFVMEASALPSTTQLGVTNLGFTNPNLPLDSLGMTGCTLLTDIQGVLPMTLALPIGTTSLAIPNIPAFSGGSLNAQAIIIDQFVNSFGVAASNGLRMTFGQ